MSEKKSTLSHRWHQEVWNKGREDAIDEMMHENVITHGLDDLKGNGMAAFKEFYRSFRGAIPIHPNRGTGRNNGGRSSKLPLLSKCH